MKNKSVIFKTIFDFFSYLLLSVLIFLSAFFAFYIAENAYANVTKTKPCFFNIGLIKLTSSTPLISFH